MKRKLITTLLVATTILAASTTSATEPAFQVPDVTIYDAENLTGDILRSRADDHEIIIEKVVGLCLDSEGNGRILNPENPDYDYISYRNFNGVMEGDVVMSLLIYNPDNGYEDDVIDRLDFIIDSLGTSAS